MVFGKFKNFLHDQTQLISIKKALSRFEILYFLDQREFLQFKLQEMNPTLTSLNCHFPQGSKA